MKLYTKPSPVRKVENIEKMLNGCVLLMGSGFAVFKNKKGKVFPVEFFKGRDNIIFSLQGVSDTAKGIAIRLKSNNAVYISEIKNIDDSSNAESFTTMVRNANHYAGVITLNKGGDKKLEYRGRSFYVFNKKGTLFKKFTKHADFTKWLSANVKSMSFPVYFYAKTEKQRRDAFKLVRLAEANSIGIIKDYPVSRKTRVVNNDTIAVMQRKASSGMIKFGF